MREGERGEGVAVLVPCRNEELTIGDVVTSFKSALPDAVVHVFDNDSTDDTAACARRAGAVVREVPLPGKGNVVRRMFADVEADVYLLVDGDATYDATVAPDLVALVRSGIDFVNTRRYSVASGAFRRGHVLGNSVMSALVRLLFARRVHDVLSGYKAVSRRFAKSFPAHSAGFEIEVELTVHALQLRAPIAEIPSSYALRPEGSASKLSPWRDGPRILRTIFGLVRQERPLAFFSCIGAVVLAAALILGLPVLLTFSHTHRVPGVGAEILASGLGILAVLSLTLGLVLDQFCRGRREQRCSVYLATPGPRAHHDLGPEHGASAEHRLESARTPARRRARRNATIGG